MFDFVEHLLGRGGSSSIGGGATWCEYFLQSDRLLMLWTRSQARELLVDDVLHLEDVKASLELDICW